MDTMFSRLKPGVGGVLLAFLTGCASEEPIQGHPGDGGFMFAAGGAWLPSGGGAGTASDPPSTGGTPTTPQDSGGTAGAAGPGTGGEPPMQTGGNGGAGATGGAGGSSGGAGGACLFGLCAPSGGAGGLGAGGAAGGSAGASVGGAAGANSCDNATCFDIFDCYLYFPQATACGFTKCEGLICKK